MTEEDTIRILKRMPFNELNVAWQQTPLSFWTETGEQWFKDRGWDKEEWLNMATNHYD